MKKRLAVILGIRPDVIRASLLLKILQESEECDLQFVWTGQHYSDNLKDIFFRELEVAKPSIELDASGDSDAALVASVIGKLHPVLEELRPDAAVFLGDTNSVMGCIAAAQLNIPVVHIEGCMRSYDWRMPEEKYRTVIDHLSDVIYAYLDEYKAAGVAEGLNPASIVVTGNPIVDVLDQFFCRRKAHFDEIATEKFFAARSIRRDDYWLMTCHRRENIGSSAPLERILDLTRRAGRPVYFPAGYRTQREIRQRQLRVPDNVIMVDPVGYEELLVLLTNSLGVLTDSGTVVEEACVLQVASVQMRKSTERPQVYEVKSSVKFDPADAEDDPVRTIQKLESIRGTTWKQPFGDGKASERIAADLLSRLHSSGFARHSKQDYHLPVEYSYRGDGIS